jgi:hypothetical protein
MRFRRLRRTLQAALVAAFLLAGACSSGCASVATYKGPREPVETQDGEGWVPPAKCRPPILHYGCFYPRTDWI